MSIVQLTDRLARVTDFNGTHQLIADILELRSKCLHYATSDLILSRRKQHAEEAKLLSDLLIRAICKLPDNYVPHAVEIVAPSGKRLILQSVVDGVAHYVAPEKWNADLYRREIPDRMTVLRAEMDANSHTLDSIHALELLDVDPVDADDQEEFAARVITQEI